MGCGSQAAVLIEEKLSKQATGIFSDYRGYLASNQTPKVEREVLQTQNVTWRLWSPRRGTRQQFSKELNTMPKKTCYWP